MSDYIDRQAALDAINRAVTKEAARWSVEELPSAEAEPIKCEDCKTIIALKAALEPVKRGRWIDIREESDGSGNRIYECSECHHCDIHAPSVFVPYCWHCGAKMEGAEV